MSPPISCSMSTLAAALETRNEPLAITSCCRSQSASVVSSSDLRQRQAGVVDDEVEPAEGEHRRVDHGLHGVGVGDVDLDADRDVAACRSRPRPPRPSPASRSATTTQAPSAASFSAVALPMPDAAPVTSATRVASGLGFGIRWSLASSSAQYSMRNFSRLVDRGVGRQALGAAHHVDGVDVELAGHAGGLLVLAVAEHADARAPARPAGRRRGWRGCRAWRCGRSSPGSPRGRRRAAPCSRAIALLDRGGRRQVEHERLDLGAQEVVGAATCRARPAAGARRRRGSRGRRRRR